MRTLRDIVHVERRFARSARIDSDLRGTPPLVGYILQESGRKALSQMATAQVEGGQGAFTWTGPYGGGKSSAALLVGNLVGGPPEGREVAKKIAGADLTKQFGSAFPERGRPWKVVPVTGTRIAMRNAIADAAAKTLGWKPTETSKIARSDTTLAEALVAAGKRHSGILLIVDELGKFLEHSVNGNGDIHLLQELAEFSSRSEGRFALVGILHQAFEQYAGALTREAQKEWAKVQGRFQDISFLAGVDETVTLLARAIEVQARPKEAARNASHVAELVKARRPTDVASLRQALTSTWPLNPVAALMLGPVSRQRFAQNERSVFGFLTSAEPEGFVQFLTSNAHDSAATYGPDHLWDYLQANFSIALSSGPDGARFSLAVDAIDRAAAKGTSTHIAIAKAAAVIELFRNGSGVAVTELFLCAALPNLPPKTVGAAVNDLVSWSVLLPRPRLGDFAMFAGSDFQLDAALDKERTKATIEELVNLPRRVGLEFVIAKRHYFRTGALRAFSVVLAPLSSENSDEEAVVLLSKRNYRGTGALVLLLADSSMSHAATSRRARSIAARLYQIGVIAAVAAVSASRGMASVAGELFALERLAKRHPQLEGDRIARREIAARASSLQDAIKAQLSEQLNGAGWYFTVGGQATAESLSAVASQLADAAFPNCPILRSELVQREKLSTNSAAAVRELGHAMVANASRENLGFSGYPAEMGLYLSVLRATGVHRQVNGKYSFVAPNQACIEGRALQPAWAAMEAVADCSLDDVYQQWSAAPFGIKRGVMPILAMASMLARRDRVALYVDGVFQPEITELVFDRLLQDPKAIRLRKVERNTQDTRFLNALASRLGLMGSAPALAIAQSLFKRFKTMPAYAQRTERLSDGARSVREIVLKAQDPEALLFKDLPALRLGKNAAFAIVDSLEEAEGVYPKLLAEVCDSLASVLGVSVKSFRGAASRCETVRGLTNDLRFDAFADRVAAFERGERDVEGLAGMLVHKPVPTWSDRDREQALLELARFGRAFREAEALAVVRDRPSTAEAVAVVVGLRPNVPALICRLELTSTEKEQAGRLAKKILATINADTAGDQIGLAALIRAVEGIASEKKAA